MSLADQGPLAGLLQAVVEALPRPTPSCLVGALAVNAWGRARSTEDVDLLVLSTEPARAEVIDALIANGFQIDTGWREHNPMAQDRVLRLRHPSHPGLPLDLLFAADAQDESALARRRSLDLLGIAVSVCSPEDLILLKLKAGRPHDFEDALGIVRNPYLHLDQTYLWGWADRLGLQGELRYVLQAAGG